MQALRTPATPVNPGRVKGQAMKSWRPPRLGLGLMILLMVIGVLALVVITDNHRTVLRALYSPFLAIIALVMVLEYLVLKGADRSSIYQRELAAAREKRRDDVLALRRMEERLTSLRERLERAAPDQGATAEELEQARAETDELLSVLRDRI